MVLKRSNSVYITINLYLPVILGLFYNREIRPIFHYFKNFVHIFYSLVSFSIVSQSSWINPKSDTLSIRFCAQTKKDTDQMRKLLVSIAIVYGDCKHMKIFKCMGEGYLSLSGSPENIPIVQHFFFSEAIFS